MSFPKSVSGFLLLMAILFNASSAWAIDPNPTQAKSGRFLVWKTMSNAVVLSWSPVSDADSYRIQVLDAQQSRVLKTVTTKAKITKKRIQGLRPETEYVFILCTEKTGQCSSNQEVRATTKTKFFLADDFEKTTQAKIANPEKSVKYVEGKEGYGIMPVYQTNANGAEVRANIIGYDNSDGQLVDPEIGTVELWVKPLMNPAEDTETHQLLSAWSDNGLNAWNIVVYKNQLIVYRDYAPCVRNILRTNFSFQKDQWYKLVLTWRGTTTRFSVNNEENLGSFQNEARNVYSRMGEKLYVGDDIFVTDHLRISSDSAIPVSAASVNSGEALQCPGFVELLEENINEEYHGIKLHNFPDDATRAKAKEFIDSLPQSYQGDILHIVLVEDAQYDLVQRPNNIANFSFAGRAMYLRKSLFDTADEWEQKRKTFFHEAGHAHVYAKGLNYGGPRGETKRKEWANISGISAYMGECSNPADFVLTDGFLTAYGSTMPDEDIAEWVGIAFSMYNKGATFSALLDKSSARYNAKFQKKIDFLLNKEFISQAMYDAVTRTTPNTITTGYTEFN